MASSVFLATYDSTLCENASQGELEVVVGVVGASSSSSSSTVVSDLAEFESLPVMDGTPTGRSVRPRRLLHCRHQSELHTATTA